MFVLIGIIVVNVMIFGGFMLAGGKFDIILKSLPFEMMIIFGGAVGAFIIANSMGIVKASLAGIMKVVKGPKWKGEDFKELLSLLYVLIKTMRSKGVVALETHIENPEESKIFQHFSRVSRDHHLVTFICDYMRMMTMNFEDPHQMEDAMEKNIERHHGEEHEVQHALQVMADGLPALGIVAAVLGIIKTMAAINEPTEVLGKMVGGALTGTFLGIFLSYTIVGPLAARFGQIIDEEGSVYHVVKATLICFLHGNAPQVAVEIGRRTVPSHHQPEFNEMEDYLSDLPPDL